MTAERLQWKLSAVTASALLLGGCVAPSLHSDLTRVRELSRVPVLARVEHAPVEPVTSQEAKALLSEPLDAERAVRIALLNNRELRAQLRALGVARGQLLQAGLAPNPVFKVESLPERDTSLELSVEYNMTSLLLTPLRAQVAAADLESARREAAAAVVQLGYEVRTAFYALQAAQQRLALAQQGLDAVAASRDMAAALLEAGNVPALEAATQSAAYERARLAVAQVELEVAEQRERLQRLLGLHGSDTSWSLSSALHPVPEQRPSLERLETRALEANLDMAATRSRMEALAQRVGLTRTQGWLPDISVDVHSLYGTPDEKPELYGEGGAWRFGAGLSFTLPLFDRQQGNSRSHEAELDSLLERYQGMAIELRSAAREARNRLLSAHARARQLQQVLLPAQRSVMEQTLLQYNAMQLGVFQLLQARRELLDVEMAQVDTLREYWSAAAALEALLAGRSVGSAAAMQATTLSTNSPSAGEH